MDRINRVTVVIGTFGSDEWSRWGEDLAATTKFTQQCPVIHVHGKTLAEARNKGAALVETEWIVFLDADDALEEDYVDVLADGDGDLRAPRLFFLEHGKDPWEPFDLTKRDIEVGNPCVIGTMIRKSMFDEVGGFQEWEAWEDYALFHRCHLIGASIVHHDAIYLAMNNPYSRNNTIKNPQKLMKSIMKNNRKWKKSYDNNAAGNV